MNWIIPISIISTLLFCHIIKEIIHISQNGTFSWYTLLLETGGMPSSHSGVVTALTTSVFLVQGFSALFWACLVLAGITMRDAFGVRRSVSDQAKIINVLSGKAKLETKVRIVLGHTPVQVIVGGIIGVGIALLVWFLQQSF